MLGEGGGGGDYGYMEKGVEYYMGIDGGWSICGEDKVRGEGRWIDYSGGIGDYGGKMFDRGYYFDEDDVRGWFGGCLGWNFCGGDVYLSGEVGRVVKSGLLGGDKENCVVVKVDKVGDLMFVDDMKCLGEKKD